MKKYEVRVRGRNVKINFPVARPAEATELKIELRDRFKRSHVYVTQVA